MTTRKIAVSLPEERVSAAKRAVAQGRAASVSAFVSQALARQEHDDDLAKVIAEMASAGNSPTADDYAWADQALGLA